MIRREYRAVIVCDHGPEQVLRNCRQEQGFRERLQGLVTEDDYEVRDYGWRVMEGWYGYGSTTHHVELETRIVGDWEAEE